MQLPNEVALFLQDCEEHGYVPGAEQFGNRFDEIYGAQKVNEWIDSLNLDELPKRLPEEDLELLPSTPYSHPHMSPQERQMKEAGHKLSDFM